MNFTILIAFIPLVAWALGDFYIQKATRKIGAVEALFFICLLSTPTILPFVYNDLVNLNSSQIVSLTGMSFLVFLYAVVLFHAFRISKLSIVESVVALELPITVAFAVIVGHETLSKTYLIFFSVICFGVFLAATKSLGHLRPGKYFLKNMFEKGVLVAILATCLSALSNFYIGLSSQTIGPLVTFWYMHFIIGILCLIYLVANREILKTFQNLLENKKIIFLQSFFDNLGWLGYVYAVTFIPISLTVTISEMYIILAAFLGYYFNKEKLSTHQKIGAIIALFSVSILTYIVGQKL